ncbi:MAG TPA: hypothetical protein VG267_10305 [Terracidiphilus sp.]|jgi:hypothetical protein|nr:hypothetical protein [Terracidiphilus sp.]
MSGILERMAKRAHGSLPGAEPLLASKFAPSARGEGDSPAVLPRPLALHVMLPHEGRSESAFSPEESVQDSRQNGAGMPAAGSPESRAQRRKRSEPMDADERSQHLSQTTSTAANLPAEHPTDSASREGRRGSTNPASVPSNATRGLPRALSQPNAEGPAKDANAPLIAADRDEPGASVTSKAEGQRGSAASRSRTHARVAEEDERAENGSGAQTKPAGALRTAAAQASATTGDARQSNAQPEEKTEIHISIGNIELRAARAETRPQPAPFRPRVTLDEFLRRGSEAQR